MDILTILLSNIIPLYLLIAMGYLGAKKLDLNLHSMAVVSIYFLSPVVVFGAITKIDFQPSYFLLPVSLFIISAVIGAFAYASSRLFFKQGKMANLIGMTSTNGNSGYFGLPIVLAFFGPEIAGIYLMMTTAIELSTNSIGYYILARGNFSVRDSVIKVIKLPPLHGMILGLVWNFFNLPLPAVFDVYWDRFAGAWTIIGMMLIGVAIGKQAGFHINFKLTVWMMSARFIIWPIVMLAFVMLDRQVFGLYEGYIHTILILLGIIPHAANAVAFASQLNVEPEDAATVVLISTVFALFFVPLSFVLLNMPFS